MNSFPSLTPETLVLPKEQTYYNILLTLSILAWIVVALTLFGALYALLAGFVFWCINGLLVSRLKSEAVRVTEHQLPALYASFRAVCGKIGVEEEPQLFLLQSHGILNAFATRHSGRNFVVLHSDLVEALGHDSPEVRFLIGHEIGHIHRSHLSKRLFSGIILLILWLKPAK